MSKPNSIPAADRSVNNLPRLTDDQRDALDIGGIAMRGVPEGEPDDDLPIKETIRQIDSINGVDIAMVCDALRLLVDLESEVVCTGDDERPASFPIIECIRTKLQDAKNRIEALCNEAVRL